MTGRSARTRVAIRLRLQAASALVFFLIAATVPYLWLVGNFGYDDILREPSATILERFARGGTPLIVAWFCFAMSSLSFVPVALSLRRLTSLHGAIDRGVSVLGIGSAIVQAIGLLRWVLVVPALTAAYAEAADGSVLRQTVPIVFDTVHRYGGMVVGEMVGQLLLAAWTGGMVLQLWRGRVVPRWLASSGACTLPLWLLGQSEVLHAVVPGLPSIPVIPLAFMTWEAWLLSLAVALLFAAWRARQAATTSNISPVAGRSSTAPR